MNTHAPWTIIALALQAMALLALLLALGGVSWLDVRSKPRVLILVDRSMSVPQASADAAVAQVLRDSKAIDAGEVRLIEFAGRAAAGPAGPSQPRSTLDPSSTNIEAALDAALTEHAKRPFTSVVMISDGFATIGDTVRALHAMQDARLPLQWIGVGRPSPTARIADVRAADRARTGEPIDVVVQVAGQLARPLRVVVQARGALAEMETASGVPDTQGLVTTRIEARREGVLVLDVALEDSASGQTLDTSRDVIAIDVVPRAAILYAQGSPGFLWRSLQAGAWSLNVVPATRLGTVGDRLDHYQAVVLDDVAISDAGPAFWNALVAAVRTRGLGLMVLGGERSFARGGYRGSTLESILPVLSEPAALDQPLSIVFAVDKSGSMGESSGAVDRFSLAQRAVLDTAGGLTERDALGLVTFDVVPRVLIPLGPATDGTRALARDWSAKPAGGTRLGPALEVAIDELARASDTRRMLVIVTDGFIDEAPLAALQARLKHLHIETIALAVGPDADLRALQRLVGNDAGSVLAVNQAAELPQVMRAAFERRRGRIERGNIAVTQPQPMPFAPDVWSDWPAIEAFAVTRPQPTASVTVETQRSDPLIAFQRAGLGRVVAVTSGLGSWNTQWLHWPAWSQLAGGLTGWISALPSAGSPAMIVTEHPGGVHVDVDFQSGPDWAAAVDATLAVQTPTAQFNLLAVQHTAPGRARAMLPDHGPGVYTLLASNAHGTERLLHLRRDRGEHDAWGTNPAVDTWKTAGLLSDWNPSAMARHHAGQQNQHPLDRSLIGLALLLFLASVIVDRTMLQRISLARSRQAFDSLRARWPRRRKPAGDESNVSRAADAGPLVLPRVGHGAATRI
jgi:Ca-activated chloride channel family protein